VRTRFEAAAEHGYGMLAELEGQLAQARSLWSGNPEIAPLEARILAAHASTALGHGDVTLARHLAERLPADAGRAPLLESVSSAESRLRRARRTRRALVAATIALLMVVVAGFAGFSWKLEQERAREAAAREAEFAAKLRANRARERGDELVNFMLGDLRDSLKQLRRLDLLDSAVERALEHYRSTAADAATEQDVARSLEGLVNCARTLSEQGRNSAALPVLRQALEMTRHPHIADPDSVEWLDYRMQVLNEVGLASSNQGRKDEGLASLTESVGIGESLVARAPDRPDILRRLGVAYSHRGMIHEDALEFKEARADYERSLEIQRRLYAAKPLRYDTGISLSRALSTMGNMYSREGDFDRAEAAFLEALGIGRAVREADPDIPRERLQELRSDEVIVLSLLGNIEENRREWKASLARYDDATSKALALFNEDPTNAMHKQHLVVLSYFASRAAAMLGNTEEAIGRLRASLGIVRELLDRDPANVDSQQQFMLISSRLASILENRGRFEESYSISASILQTVGDGPLFDGEVRLTRGRRKAMLTLVRNLQQLGRYQESLDAAAPLLRSRPRDLRDPVDFDAAQDLALAHALAAHACLVLRCGEQTATYLANAESLVDIAREIPRADIRFTELICSILRARIAEREGDREAMLAAHGHIRRLMEEEPDFRNSIFAINPLVLVHIQLGEVDQARELRRNMPRRPPQLDPFFFSYANETGWKD
jgi:tetratricopeptide (TPR) repeat protein